MPRYRVRLESPDLTRENGDPHFRVTTLVAESEEEARERCERKEYEIAAHRLDDDTLAELERAEADAQAADARPDATTRMRLASHRQAKPYEVVSVKEV